MSYPNPLAPKAEKDSKKYGLQFAKYIETEWVHSGKFESRNKIYRENDAYCEDNVPIDKFKRMFGMDADKIWTGMSWKYVSVVPKFVNVVKDSLKDDLFSVRAVAMDLQSSEERKKYRNRLKTAMYGREAIESVSAITGMNLMPDYVPDSVDELDLHMQLKYKQSRETAAELIIDRVQTLNGMTELNSELKEDLMRYGIGAVRVNADPNYGVTLDRQNPHTFIYSLDTTYTRNKKGSYYFASIQQVTSSELTRLSQGELTEKEIANIYNTHPYESALYQDTDSKERLVSVMHFCFKTSIKDVFKRKKNNLTKKDDTFVLHPDSKSVIISGYRDVWYEGYYILGTELVFGYRMMRDMIRKSKNIMQVLPPYVVYQITTPCIVSQLKAFNDDAQIALLKLRHLVLNARPQGFEINIDALQKLDVGGGMALTPIEVLDIYNQTGNLLYSTRNFDMEESGYQSNIRPIASTLGEVSHLINVYNNALNMCYEVTGVNRTRDGSSSTANTLLGVSEMALEQSNTATKLYLDAVKDINKGVAEIILNRSQQLSLYGERMCDEICSIFFDESDEVQSEVKSIHKYNFDVHIDMQPTQKEYQQLQVNIQNAVQAGQISLVDAIDIQNIKNLKLASDYLKIAMDKRHKQQLIEQQQMEQAKVQAQAQADIAIKQAEMQKTQMELQARQYEAQFQAQQTQMEIKLKTEAELILMDRKYQYEMQLAQMQVQANSELNKFKEDAKDKRIDKQSTQQSKMITQRQYQTSPMDFEQETRDKQIQAQQSQIPPQNPPIQPPQQYETSIPTEQGT
jgi:hypothetical protein